jgi:hypothetical protein
MLSYVQAAVLNNSSNSIAGSESNRKYGNKHTNNNNARLKEGKKVRARTEETEGGCNKEESGKHKKEKGFPKRILKASLHIA